MSKLQTGHVIATALNVVQTLHSYGDMLLCSKASEFKQVSEVPFTHIQLNLLDVCEPSYLIEEKPFWLFA